MGDWDWLSEIVDGLGSASKELMGGMETAMGWVSGDSLSSGAEDAAPSLASTTSPADVARLDTHPDETTSVEGGATQAGWTPGGAPVGSKGWVQKTLDELGKFAEENPKTTVALGSGAAALLKANEQNLTNQIMRSHYASQDATAAGKLALEQVAQQNALTSGHNLNVNGLPGVRPNGLIQSNVDIPRLKRNRDYGA